MVDFEDVVELRLESLVVHELVSYGLAGKCHSLGDVASVILQVLRFKSFGCQPKAFSFGLKLGFLNLNIWYR